MMYSGNAALECSMSWDCRMYPPRSVGSIVQMPARGDSGKPRDPPNTTKCFGVHQLFESSTLDAPTKAAKVHIGPARGVSNGLLIPPSHQHAQRDAYLPRVHSKSVPQSLRRLLNC